jgi:hypothetical protein
MRIFTIAKTNCLWAVKDCKIAEPRRLNQLVEQSISFE